MGKNTIKGTMVTKVGILIEDYILHMSYMYWSIKYQNYISNVIYGTRYTSTKVGCSSLAQITTGP
jgi:hypothetical protein